MNKKTNTLLFTSPHDGYLIPDDDDFQERDKVPDECQANFEKVRDLYTSEITYGVAWKIYLLTGQQGQQPPPTVIQKYHRKYMDVNRCIICAFENQAAEVYYFEYHGLISRYLKEMYIENKDENLMSYLFDIHGYNRTSTDQADIILGTNNGDTIWKLRKNHPDAINDLITMLEEKGYSVHHATGNQANPDLNGAYTISHYSSPTWLYACNAFQIELADELRTSVVKRQNLIVNLAESLKDFVSKFPTSV
jgi:N-formylglutamate amidohydrolase